MRVIKSALCGWPQGSTEPTNQGHSRGGGGGGGEYATKCGEYATKCFRCPIDLLHGVLI